MYELRLRSATMLFFKLSAKRYGIGLSNELVFIKIAQEAAKLSPVKVGGQENLTFLVRGSALSSKFNFFTHYLKSL